MDVFVALEGAVAARRYLEVAELAAMLGFLEEHLAGDAAERRRPFVLVREHLDVVPAEGLVVGTEATRVRRLLQIHVPLLSRRTRAFAPRARRAR